MNNSNFNMFLSRSPFGKLPKDFAKAKFDFIDERNEGGLDKALHPGVHFGPWKFNFNSTKSVPIGDCTFATGSTVNCPNHGLPAGHEMLTDLLVRIEAIGDLPSGVSNTEYYSPLVVDVDNIQLYLEGVLVTFDETEADGEFTLVKRGTAYDFTGATVAAKVKSSVDGSVILDLAPTFSGTIPGQVIIDLAHTVTTGKATATAFWDMVITLLDVDITGPWVEGQFDINKLITVT